MIKKIFKASGYAGAVKGVLIAWDTFFGVQELRSGKDLKNDKDLAKYLHDVLIIRSRQENDCER